MSDHEDNLRIKAAARLRANELRRQQADAYWSAATRFTRARMRSAKRLAGALARHVRARTPSEED
jgi:hypothetical protein